MINKDSDEYYTETPEECLKLNNQDSIDHEFQLLGYRGVFMREFDSKTGYWSKIYSIMVPFKSRKRGHWVL